MNVKKILAGCLLTVASIPLLPVIITGAIAGKATGSGLKKYADYGWKHPFVTIGGLALAGTIAYNGCTNYDRIKTAIQENTKQTITRIESGLEERLRQNAAEKKATEALHRTTKELETKKEQVATLEKTLQDYTSRLQEYSASNEQLRTQLTQESAQESRGIPLVEKEGSAFYYVKVGDTLAAIAQRVSGDARNYTTLARANNINDPRKLMAGQLLEIPKSLCTRPQDDVYERVPLLSSTIVPGNKPLSQAFPETWKDVIEINKKLGLTYTDTFPYPAGSRVVYYPK